MKRPLLILTILIWSAAALTAQTSWRGQASVSNDGSLPETGFFAATNEFPRGTILTVENLRTRQSLKVRVMKRAPSVLDANFIFLSPEAAKTLNLQQGEGSLVTVQVDTGLEGIHSALLEDREFSPDPETNPAQGREGASSGDAELASDKDTTPSASAPMATSNTGELPTAAPVTAAGEEAPVNPVLAPDIAVATTAPTATVAAIAADAAAPPATASAASPETVQPAQAPEFTLAPEGYNPALEEDLLAARTPEKRIFLPPRESAMFASKAPEPTLEAAPAPTSSPEAAVPVAASPATAEPELPLPAIAEVPLAPQASSATEAPVAAAPQSATEASADPVTTAEITSTESPALEPRTIPQAQTASIDTVEPAVITAAPESSTEAPRAPEPTPASKTPVAAAEKAPEQAPLTATPPPAVAATGKKTAEKPLIVTPSKRPLTKNEVKIITGFQGGDYVQLAAFSDEGALLKALDTVKTHVPLSLVMSESAKTPYRLVAGPVRRDQVGILVMHYRSQGYRAAEVIKGK